MKKFLGIILALVLLMSCAVADEAAPALTKDLYILFTSDAHCGIESGFGYEGLFEIKNALAENYNVLLVDDGDAIQGEPVGTMTKGAAIIDLMNAVGYDVITMGNHEFDYGMDNFLALAEKTNAPYVSCNFTHNGELVFKPYVIKEVEGLKVAIVGVTTPKTFTSSTPTYFQDENGNYVYGFCEGDGTELYAAVQKAVDDARGEGADKVVVIAHLGIEAECAPYMSTDVILNTNGIDALLDGHSHSELTQEIVKNKDGEDVILAACGTKLANIGYLKIAADGKLSSGLWSWKNDVAYPTLLNVNNSVSEALTAATASLNEALASVVAQSDVGLFIYDPVETKVRLIRNTETNLGDLCADAYRYVTGADVALVNGGGIRVNIAAGNITMNDVYKVHPFGNSLCMVKATGKQILDALEWTSRSVPGENGGFLQVSGLTYEIHSYIASSAQMDDHGSFAGVTGEYRVKNVMVGGEPLDLEKVYTVASHNYLLKDGGDGTNCFTTCEVVLDEIMLDNQVLITYVTEGLNGVVGGDYSDPYGQGRIVIVNEAK